MEFSPFGPGRLPGMEGYLTLNRSNAWIAGVCLLLAVALSFAWQYIGLVLIAAAAILVLYFLLRNPYWAFLVFMFSLPFATLRLIPIRGVSNLAFMAIIVLFFSLLLNLRRLPAFRIGSLGIKPWLYATFIFAALLGIIFSINQANAIRLTGMALTVFALYIAGTLLLTTPRRWQMAVNSLLLGAFASALVILYDYFFIFHPLDPDFYRAGSLYAGGPASGSVICFLIAIPAALYLAESQKWRQNRAFYYLVALASVGVIVLSATRSAWLALAVLALIEFVRRPLRTAIALGLTAALTIGLVSIYLPSTYQKYAARIFIALNPEYGPQLQVGFRIENYYIGLRMLASYPILGVGMNNFGAHAGRFGRATVPLDLNLNAHNSFMEVLTGTGLVGGLAYILVWLLTFYEFIFIARRGPPSWRPLAVALALGFMMLAIHSMFHSPHSALLLAPIFALGSVMRRDMLRKQATLE